MRNLLPLLAFLLLASCASRPAPVTAERQAKALVHSAVSFLGDELVVDLAARSVLGRVSRYPVAEWKVNDSVVNLLKEGAQARGKEYRELRLDPKEAEKALHVRESRWRRVTGRYNQALLDFLLRNAQEQGIDRLFVVLPIENPERPPVQKGNFGVRCRESKEEGSRASVYFSFQLALWDVPGQKRVFDQDVGPEVTEVMTFGDCRIVAEAKDPAHDLEDPLKRTLGLVVDAVYDKLGWKRLSP